MVAFGGRAFGDEQPKYLNSPETPLYTKGNLLYAADLARETIREKNRALIVEGYVDCLMAHQHGFTETVAALGTAFTAAQLGVLRRYCDEVVTFFDADAAGQKAAERAEELLEPTRRRLRVGASTAPAPSTTRRRPACEGRAAARRPRSGHLPARRGRAGLRRAHRGRAQPACPTRSTATIGDADGGQEPRGRTNAFARVALMLAKVPDAQEAAALSREAAAKLGVDPTQLWIEAQRLAAALRKPVAPSERGGDRTARRRRPRTATLVTLLLLVHAAPGPRCCRCSTPATCAPGAARGRRSAAGVARRSTPELLMTDGRDRTPPGMMLSALIVEDGSVDDAASSIEQFQRRLECRRSRRRQSASSAGPSLSPRPRTGRPRRSMDALLAVQPRQQARALRADGRRRASGRLTVIDHSQATRTRGSARSPNA